MSAAPAKFTPGPWERLDPHLNAEDGCAWGTIGFTKEADYVLALSAPDLYMALCKLQTWVEHNDGSTDALDLAVEVLAKARGET